MCSFYTEKRRQRIIKKYMKKESIKTFFKSQCPPDSGKIEQWYIDNIDSSRIRHHPAGVIERMHPTG